MSDTKTIRLQINADLAPMGTKGQVIEVPVSRTGIMKNRYWRRRLKDAKTDKCVEILKKGDIGFAAKAKAEAAAEAEAEAKTKKTTKAKPGAKEGVNTDG